LFWRNTSKADKRNFCPIYVRITIKGKRSQFSTGIKVSTKEWDDNRKKIRGNSDRAILANSKLTSIKDKLDLIHLDRERKNLPITSKIIKEAYLNPIHAITILSIYDEIVAEKEQLVEAGELSPRTTQKWRGERIHLLAFLEHIKHQNLLIEELNIDIAKHFFLFLKTHQKLAHNSATKCARKLKTIADKAIEKEIMSINRLKLWVLPNQKKPKSKYVWLNDKELSKLENYRFTSQALQKIADLYIFQCYTGFRYSDLKTFDFEIDTFPYEGEIYISKTEFKTDENALLPLFPKALEILKKYQMELPKPPKRDKIISNAKYNKHLKKIAEILGVKKNLTTHTARVTAGMKWLNSGVPIEIVAQMLGDTVETVRRHYAYILPNAIHRETEHLRKQ